MDKLILTAALTGAITVPSQTPHLPFTADQIADDAAACAEAGAASIHIHARDPQDGRPRSDPELFADIATKIKERTDAIVCITTGGGMGMTPMERLRSVPVLAPELASFNLGSINFSMHPVARRFQPEDWRFDWEKDYVEGTENFIFPNSFSGMKVFAETMGKYQTVPEFEAYDVGHLYNLKFLEKEGLVQPPYWMQFVLGVLGALAANPRSLITMLDTAERLFGRENFNWSVIGVGYPYEFHMAAMGIMMGGHVRVGLEDNLFVRRRELATNAQLVSKAVRMADEFEREIATPDEARQILGLKGKTSVNF